MSFDESKIIRDDHGRFSGGGMGGFVAKHTGKLQGYASHKNKGALDKWAGKISGRARDIEVPLVRKTEEHVASTGMRPVTEISGVHAEDNGRGTMSSPLHTMVLESGQKLFKEVSEARRAAKKEFEKNDKITDNLHKVSKERKSLETAKEAGEAWTAEQQIALDKALKKEKKVDADLHKHNAVMKSIQEREENMNQMERAHLITGDVRKAIGDGLDVKLIAMNRGTVPKDADRTTRLERSAVNYRKMMKEAQINVSRGHDGSWEFHLEGVSHDENFPGEKSMTVSIVPARVGRDKDDNVHIKEPARVSIVSQYPTDRRGKDHPAAGEVELPFDSRHSTVLIWKKKIEATVAEHAKNFFTT